MRQVKQNEKLGVMLIILSALGYGLMPIFSIYAINNGTKVPSLLFLRFSLAAIILWVYIWITGKRFKTDLRTLVYIISICLLGFTVASLSIYNAYEHISGSIATLILFTHPFFVLLMEVVIKKKVLHFRKLMAMLIVMVGLIFVLYTGETSLSTKGILFSFVSSMAYAVFCFGLGEKKTQELEGIVITAYMASVTALTAGVNCWIEGLPLLPLDTTSLISGICLAVFSTLVASVAFYEGLSIVGPSSATLISSFEPVFVVVLSALFLKEALHINVLIGGSIIILGIILLEKKKIEANSKTPTL